MSKKEIPQVPLPRKKSDEEEKKEQQPLQAKPKDILDDILLSDKSEHEVNDESDGEKTDTTLKNLSPPYSNQNINMEKKNMATDLCKNEETALIVEKTPTVFAICAGEGGSKCGINEFLPLAGPLVKKRVDPNNKYDVAAFAAMIQVPIKEAKSIAEDRKSVV